MIGRARAGRDINIAYRAGLGAFGVALIVGVALLASNLMRPAPVIDPQIVVALAEQQGYVSPSAAEVLLAQVERTQADLDELRRQSPDWAAEVDRVIRAFNRSDIEGAREAFAEIDRLISQRRAELSAELARSKHAQATLLYPFQFSRSEPLLCDAADLAETEIWYWIECGLARMAIGSLERAGAAFQTARNLAETSGSERGLAVALGYLGDVRMAQGDLQAALGVYEITHEMLGKRAAADPGNAEWQRDLSVSWEKIGDVRRAQGDLAGALDAHTARHAIAEQLAAADPGNAGWQRDLSVSWNKIGDVRVAQGDLAGALDAYTATHDILGKLAAADPGNAGWQRDLSVSWNKIGDVRVAQGDLTGALDAYAADLAIAEKLAAADPGNAEWQRDLIVSHVKLSGVAAETAEARAHLVTALEIARALEAEGRLAPVDAFIPGMLEERLAVLDR